MSLHTIKFTDEELIAVSSVINTILMSLVNRTNPSEKDIELAKYLRTALDKMESKYYDEKFTDKLKKKIILSTNKDSH